MWPELGGTTTDLETRFRELYDAALPVVYGFVLFRVGRNSELAEDLTAETFAAPASEFRAGRPELVTVAWLRTVARRRIIDYWQHQSVVEHNTVGSGSFNGLELTTLPTTSSERGLRQRWTRSPSRNGAP